MISKELVYKYLSEGLLSEKLFNFKEDDPKTDQNQDQDNQDNVDTEEPEMDWHIYQKDLILYSGSSSDPYSQYYPFADDIRYAKFKDKDKDDDRNKNKDNKSFDKLKNFATAVVFGGVTAVASSEARDWLRSFDKDKKNSKGQTDKWAESVKACFSGEKGLEDFKKHAEEHHVPAGLLNEYVRLYQEMKSKEKKNNQGNKDNEKNNQRSKPIRPTKSN